uniref:Uncharacterized protein n=1 Tax=Panagrolaimus sp. JU765 TaxID=591449 RepID=A0AC34QL27_9BILA
MTATDKELRGEVIRFTRTTTAHGIPMILNSHTWFARSWWTTLTIFAVVFCSYQCLLVIEKYNRKDKIVNVELQFEQAAFPAITVCNLNPFKNHLARKVPEISETVREDNWIVLKWTRNDLDKKMSYDF